jgi:alanine-alpha-ketoisovalerate/valine-pyruvate aminotransferase
MDVGVISMIASNTEIGEVVAQYSGAIHSGASAIGRILLNAMVKKNSIIEQVGEPKYKQMVNSLRAVFVKISDLYVDITRLQLESDGKVAN